MCGAHFAGTRKCCGAQRNTSRGRFTAIVGFKKQSAPANSMAMWCCPAAARASTHRPVDVRAGGGGEGGVQGRWQTAKQRYVGMGNPSEGRRGLRRWCRAGKRCRGGGRQCVGRALMPYRKHLLHHPKNDEPCGPIDAGRVEVQQALAQVIVTVVLRTAPCEGTKTREASGAAPGRGWP